MHQKQSSISQLPAHAMHKSTRNLMGRRWQAAEMPKWTWHHQTQKRSSSIEQTRMKPKWLQIPKSTPKVYPLPPNTNNIWVGVGSAPFDPTLTLPRGPTQTHLKRRRPDPTRPTRLGPLGGGSGRASGGRVYPKQCIYDKKECIPHTGCMMGT